MSNFHYGRVCGDHATVLLLQGSPVSYLRRSNSDAAFTLKSRTLCFMFCVCQLFYFLFVVIFCMLHTGRLQKNRTLNFEVTVQRHMEFPVADAEGQLSMHFSGMSGVG